MPITSGTVEVGAEPTPVCAVPPSGVRVRNLGGSSVWIGGADVTGGPDGPGFPMEPGASESFPGAAVRESPIVPAPADDLAPPQLYGITEEGVSRVAWLAAG